MHVARIALISAVFTGLIISGCDRPERDSDGEWKVEIDTDNDKHHAEKNSAEAVAKADESDTKKEGAESDGKEGLVPQQRNIEDFDAIEMHGAADLKIVVGPAASVSVETSERRQKDVKVHVEGHTLQIDVTKMRGWFGESGPLKLAITTPELKSLESNGAGAIAISGLHGGDQKLELAGAHDVKGEGSLDKLTIELSGAGSVDFKNVETQEAKVEVNGAGNVEVTAKKSLHAEVNGVGAVRYGGNPEKVESELHGLGSITRR
jgi:hypothetical protein